MLGLPLLLSLATTQAQPVRCEEIRAVRALAEQEKLDAQTLEALERRHCALATPAGASSDCQTITTMLALAQVAPTADDAAMLESERAVACASSSVRPAFNWSSGQAAKYSDGSWRYPSGAMARLADGTWQYPTGTPAALPDGSWLYPGGALARAADGSWRTPAGRTVTQPELVREVCDAAPEACQERLGATVQEGALSNLQLIGLAWDALSGPR